MSKKVWNEDVPYDTIIRVLLKKIKSQEEDIKDLKKDDIEKNVCQVIKSFRKSLNLTQHQILQLKLNPYYLSQVRENINLKSQICKLKIGLISKCTIQELQEELNKRLGK